MKTKTKLWIGVAVLLVAVVAALVGVKGLQIGSMISAGKSFVPPPEAVTTAQVEATTWQPLQAASGTLVAFRGVTVGSELPGAIREVSFDSGTFVRKGAVLMQLDTSTEEAQLASAKADENLARLNYERAVEVRKGQANTPADLDAAEARYKQAQAAVEHPRGRHREEIDPRARSTAASPSARSSWGRSSAPGPRWPRSSR